jgi:hypothetical protein
MYVYVYVYVHLKGQRTCGSCRRSRARIFWKLCLVFERPYKLEWPSSFASRITKPSVRRLFSLSSSMSRTRNDDYSADDDDDDDDDFTPHCDAKFRCGVEFSLCLPSTAVKCRHF